MEFIPIPDCKISGRFDVYTWALQACFWFKFCRLKVTNNFATPLYWNQNKNGRGTTTWLKNKCLEGRESKWHKCHELKRQSRKRKHKQWNKLKRRFKFCHLKVTNRGWEKLNLPGHLIFWPKTAFGYAWSILRRFCSLFCIIIVPSCELIVTLVRGHPPSQSCRHNNASNTNEVLLNLQKPCLDRHLPSELNMGYLPFKACISIYQVCLWGKMTANLAVPEGSFVMIIL